MSCVYEVMSDCGRASSDSMAKAQKSRDLYKSLLRNRTSPTKIVQEKRRVVVRRKPKSAGLSSCETKLSNLLDSKAKLMLPMTHTYFNNQTPVPIPGQRAGVSCRTGDVPRLVVRRTYSSDALRTQQRELENTQQLHQSNSREQGSIQDASLPSDDMDSLDKLNFQEGWKNDKEKSVSSGPNFVQVFLSLFCPPPPFFVFFCLLLAHKLFVTVYMCFPSFRLYSAFTKGVSAKDSDHVPG